MLVLNSCFIILQSMTSQELKIHTDKIIEAVKYSSKKLIEDKKRLGQKIVISKNGVIKYIEAKDL